MADSTLLNQVGFAPEIAPFAISNLEAAKKAVATPYQSYADWAKSQGLTGDQIASFTDLQKQAFGQAGNLSQDPYAQASAQGLQSLAGQQFGQQQADQYMSPYIQNVIQNQQRDAARMSAFRN